MRLVDHKAVIASDSDCAVHSVMTTTLPPRPEGQPDRFLDAQEAVEAAVLELIENAVAAGWAEREVIAAIIAVAENRMLAVAENEELDELLRRLNL